MTAFDASSTAVIIGASLAGLRCAETLRAEDFEGRIVLVGAEKHLPYDRPPLSKQFLAGKWGLEKIQLRDREKVDALGLEMRLGHQATSLDIEGHRIDLDDGSTLGYDGLVVATGAHPRLLPGTRNTATTHLLRTLEDSIALSEATSEPETRLVVVGAGFIGSEVAATCHGRGSWVTVIEALSVPLEQALGPEIGAVCSSLHSDNGVDLRTSTTVTELREDGVVLDDGSFVAAEAILVGIGVVPTTEWLEGSGLEIRNGVVADATLHASDDVVVAGDVCRWYDEGLGAEVRIEHWTNASEQGAAAARSLLAGRVDASAYVPVPYVWSDQYDAKIQVLGHPGPQDEVVVVDGSLEDRRFVALYAREGRLTAAIGFNRPRQLMHFRQLLENRVTLDEAIAAKPA